MPSLKDSVAVIDAWPVDHASTAVVADDGRILASHGETQRSYPLASVTKLLSAYAALMAIEEGAVDLGDPAGPEGSTVRHLLAHTSGLEFDQHVQRQRPGKRRVYSNAGFEVLGETIAEATGMEFAAYLQEGVLAPLGMEATVLKGSPAAGAESTAADMARFAAELQRPTLLHSDTVAEATAVVFGGLDGVLPGFGRQSPNDWGLGFEIRDGKSPHWTGSANSARTFGHFGQSGTFLWVDPEAGAACVVLTDRDFAQWAVDAWPAFSDGVLEGLKTLSRA
ncbi:serine hydrolase domain-containing protein [Arthrobacter castelli]|uniref:serine hydrolase domain-containing protein n=1 Tax=Arthrobacter castelli TaxID=271431 RepID=UPI000406E7EC|nr:serine hydrolase domain-containing protein [Arthrobacter castelli]